MSPMFSAPVVAIRLLMWLAEPPAVLIGPSTVIEPCACSSTVPPDPPPPGHGAPHEPCVGPVGGLVVVTGSGFGPGVFGLSPLKSAPAPPLDRIVPELATSRSPPARSITAPPPPEPPPPARYQSRLNWGALTCVGDAKTWLPPPPPPEPPTMKWASDEVVGSGSGRMLNWMPPCALVSGRVTPVGFTALPAPPGSEKPPPPPPVLMYCE